MTTPGQQAFGGRINVVANQLERGGMPAVVYAPTKCELAIYPVVDEVHQLIPRTYSTDDYCTLTGEESIIGATTDWTAPDTKIKLRSVTVKNVDKTITYIESSTGDYTVDYEAGEIIRNDVSRIPVGSSISVSYRWQEPCLNPETGAPRPDCPICGGNGVIYTLAANIIGLFHIPNYDSQLAKVGYFEIGDAFFTTSSTYNFGAGGDGTGNLYTRDILVINDGTIDQVWRVLAKPNTIQLAGEYLAKKLHIRKIKEGETITDLIQGST